MLTDYAIIQKWFDIGCNLIPVPHKKKSPEIEWKPYQQKRISQQELEAFFKNKLINVAIICGRVSCGNIPGSSLIVVDSDSDEGEKWLLAKKLPKTLTVQTGSRGFHRYYRIISNKEIKKSKLHDAVDLQAENSIVIAPPSIHPSGNAYQIHYENDWQITALQESDFHRFFPEYSSRQEKAAYIEEEDDNKPSLEQVAAKLGIKRISDTGNYLCPSTRHTNQAENPTLDLRNDRWYCHGKKCEYHKKYPKGGDYIDLVRAVKKVDFEIANNWLEANGFIRKQTKIKININKHNIDDLSRYSAKILVDRCSIYYSSEHTGGVYVKNNQLGIILQALTDNDWHYELSHHILYGEEKYNKEYPDKPIFIPSRTIPASVLRNFQSERFCQANFPEITNIATAPIFSENGTLLNQTGYYPECKTYVYLTKDIDNIQIPEYPTDLQIEEAKDFIMDELIVNFPFVSEADMTNAISMLLLPFARHLIKGCTPAYFIRAPEAGTGKSLLARIVWYLFTGKGEQITPFTGDGKEEDNKILFSKLREKRAIIQLDNITNLKSSILDEYLTAEMVGGRVLKESKTQSTLNNAVWILTANNLVIEADTARRLVLIDLNAKCELPGQRPSNMFKHTPLEEFLRNNRKEIITHILTIIQSWLVANRPIIKGVAMGSFEDYCNVMNSILTHANFANFLNNTGSLFSDANPEEQEWKEFYRVLSECEIKFYSVKELANIALDHDLFGWLKNESGKVNCHKMGRQLIKHAGKVLSTFYLQKSINSRTGASMYKIENILGTTQKKVYEKSHTFQEQEDLENNDEIPF